MNRTIVTKNKTYKVREGGPLLEYFHPAVLEFLHEAYGEVLTEIEEYIISKGYDPGLMENKTRWLLTLLENQRRWKAKLYNPEHIYVPGKRRIYDNK